MKYLVKWEIDSDADTPEEAAREAFATMQKQGTIATVFNVKDTKTKKVTRIDLEELEAVRQVWDDATVYNKTKWLAKHKFDPRLLIVGFDELPIKVLRALQKSAF